MRHLYLAGVGTLVIGALVLGTAAASARSTKVAARGPFLLVTLPSLGTVTWSCGTRRHPYYALGYRASPKYASTFVELRLGNRRVSRQEVHPGRRLRFPFSSERRQHLFFRQGTGAGELRASVTARFVPNLPTTYCAAYAPPALTIFVSPRA